MFPHVGEVRGVERTHLFFRVFVTNHVPVPVTVCVRARLRARASAERMPGRKRQRVCGILLRRHKRDMRSPRPLVIMRECIVAVFKTAALDG